MRPEDWERAEELFHRLAPLGVAQRSESLAEVSSTEPDLAADVRSLLSAHDSEGLLDRLTAKIAPEAPGAGLSVAPLTGSFITHYEVGKLVGRGGMGDVYHARDTRLDREVALKFLPAWLGRDPAARDRFLVEARIVSSIDHPNVCTLFDIGETHDGRLFLVMPFYDGETLKQRLAKGSLTEEETLDVALQVARGLAAAHERGIVHRDVKPGNLLLADDGRVKILDFGVAKLTDVSLTRPGETPGTESYMAPEQAAGGVVDARADLWALGAVMYEMLTGVRPAGSVDSEVDGPTPLIDRLANTPRGLAETVVRLLAIRPDERYPDAWALIEDLEVLAGGPGSLSARPAPSLKRFLAELKRRHVFRVAAVYGVAGFAVIEAADMIFPRVPLPEWTVSLVVWLVLLGFPIALVLAWAFEMAPGGVRRTRSVRPAILDAIAAQPAGRRWPIGVAGLIGGLLLAGTAWLTLETVVPTVLPPHGERGGAEVTAAGQPVAVLPFRVVSADTSLQNLREGAAYLLSSSIETVEGLRKVDPAAVMKAWSRRFGDSAEAPETSAGLEVAARLGARYAIAGSVVSSGDRVRLVAEAFDLQQNVSTGTTRAEAARDSIFDLVDGLAVAILRDGLLPARGTLPVQLSRVTTTSLPAFTAYLEGEDDFRRGRYEDAASHFVRAAELDSTFARAMFRASLAYQALADFGLAGQFGRKAGELGRHLPSRDSLLLVSRSDYSPTAIESLELYTRLYPDDPDGWLELGERYFHLGGKALRPAEAYRNAWRKALELGDIYAEQREHWIWDAVARRDSAETREQLDAYAGLEPEGHPCPEFEIIFADAWLDEDDQARVHAEHFPSIGEPGFSCGWTALSAGTAESVSRFERRDLPLLGPTQEGAGAYWRTMQARMMRGELSRAREILAMGRDEPALAGWGARYAIQWHLTGFPDSSAADAARRLLESESIAPPARSLATSAGVGSNLHFGSHTSPFFLAVLAVEEGRWAEAQAQAARLAALADTIAAVAPQYQGETVAMVEAIRHYIQLSREWDPDLGEFEDTLNRLRSIGFAKEEPEMYLRYWMGSQLLERGDLRGAERYFRTFSPFHWSHYVPVQFHLGRIYEELGDRVKAREHYKIFTEWWETADPELQPWRDRGLDALRRLAPDS